MDFSGKRVVVAGGSRGIGRSCALAFAQAGARVSICARSEGPLRETQALLGAGAHAAVCDLGNGPAVLAYVAEAAAALGGIDILVTHASGFGAQLGALLQRNLRSYSRNVGLNFGRLVALTMLNLLFGTIW